MKILAIDDRPDNLTVLKAVLLDRLPDAGLVTALNGPKGLELAESEDPDVILLDIVMPDMDGYDVCRRLKADVLLKTIPVLFLTAHTDRDSRIKAVEAGADGFLSKPFDEIELTVQILAMTKLKAANRLQRLEKEELAAIVAERTRELEHELADRKKAEAYREITREVLQILNGSGDIPSCLRRILSVVKTRTGFAALGIRLQDGEDFPYFIQEGFSKEFLRTENSLLSRSAAGDVCRDKEGNPCLECTCGLVISGVTSQANPLFTAGGSFWTNNSPTLLDIPADKDPRHHPRNLCIRCGYASVALIPIRMQDKIAGLIQLNDRTKDRFTIEVVELMEGIAAHIGETLVRKQAEEASKREQHLTSAIIESIPGAFYMLDKDGRYVRWNAYQRDEIVGKPEALVAGTDAIDTIHPDDREFLSAKIANVLEKGVHETVEGRVLLKGGPAFRWLLMAGRQMVIDGSPFLLGIGIDITERRRAEDERNKALLRAEAAAAAKSEFLGIMSHELRTPLNGVLGFSELLADTPLDEEQKSCVDTISKSGEHLLAIVNDILDFSSIENGAIAIQVEPFAFAGLVESSEQAVRKSAMDKGLEIRSVIGPGVPEQIPGDERRIRQILINLLGNAVKFTSNGSVTLRVETVKMEGRQFLDFSVEDTGIGMTSETMELLFHPFVQADMKRNRTFGGTGLGLAISQRLAEAMGGKITILSTPGKGSTFTFHLPLEILPPSSEPADAAPCDPDSAQPAGALVLVVEDDHNSTVLAGKILQRLGCRAEFAADGAEAVKTFEPAKFSAILMDMAMPVMDGIEATKIIRARESGSRVPIIALTANVMPGDRERCLDAGMDDFLSKPFKKDELAAILARVAQR